MKKFCSEILNATSRKNRDSARNALRELEDDTVSPLICKNAELLRDRLHMNVVKPSGVLFEKLRQFQKAVFDMDGAEDLLTGQLDQCMSTSLSDGEQMQEDQSLQLFLLLSTPGFGRMIARYHNKVVMGNALLNLVFLSWVRISPVAFYVYAGTLYCFIDSFLKSQDAIRQMEASLYCYFLFSELRNEMNLWRLVDEIKNGSGLHDATSCIFRKTDSVGQQFHNLRLFMINRIEEYFRINHSIQIDDLRADMETDLQDSYRLKLNEEMLWRQLAYMDKVLEDAIFPL
jgi:hypothetical protein